MQSGERVKGGNGGRLKGEGGNGGRGKGEGVEQREGKGEGGMEGG